MSGPLEGVNVLEMCAAGVGPFSTSILGALGANVVKIEPPSGDVISIMAPYQQGISAVYTQVNLNKRSVTADLKTPEGRALGESLLKEADVFVENMRPGRVGALGLGYERALELNPRIVYASCPAWGFTGPMTDLPGIDGHVQLFSGFASLNGDPGALPEMYRHPQLDWITGAYLAAATITGLVGRVRTGKPQHVKIAHLAAGISVQISRLAEFFATGETAPLLGSGCAATVPHQAFRTQDGKYLAVGVLSEPQWAGLRRALGDDEALEEPRFVTNRDRVAHRDELVPLLEERFRAKPARWWSIQLTKHRVPHSLFLDLDTLLYHGQVTQNRYIAEMEMPHRGPVNVGGAPWRFGETPLHPSPAPISGEHTEEIVKGGFGTKGLGDADGTDSDAAGIVLPLEGLRVLDLTEGIAGPYASLLLADAGAEVVKIEPPGGDHARGWVPACATGDSAAFALLNRNKRGMTLDLETGDDGQAFQEMAAHADIVLEELGPEETKRLGIDYGTLRQSNAGLVYCALSAYGEEGPLAGLPGSEFTVQAASDMWRSIGAIGEPPVRIGADVASLTTGILAYIGVLGALFRRARAGPGQRVALSAFGAAVYLRGVQWGAQSDPDDWQGFYCEDYVTPRHHGYQTADFPVFFNLHTCTEDEYFQLIIRLGMEEVLADPRFDLGGRHAVGMGRYSHEVRHLWEAAFDGMTSREVVDLILEHHGMAVAMNDYARLFEHEQVQGLDLLRDLELPGGAIRCLVSPFRINDAAVAVKPLA